MKIIYGLIITLVLGAGIYFWTGSSTEEQSSSTSSSKKSTNGQHEASALSESSSKSGSGTSVWNDRRITSGEGISNELVASAEISNNLENMVQLYRDGNDAEFLAKIDALILAHPDVPEYIALKGDYFYNEGKWPEAEEAIRQLVKVSPDNLTAKTTLSEVLAAQGRYGEADDLVKEVLAKDPGNKEALYAHASTAELKGDSKEGLKFIREHYKKNPTNPDVAVVMADIAQAEGMTELRRQVVEYGMKHNPNDALTRVAATDAYRDGDFKTAISLGETALSKSKGPEAKSKSYQIIYDAAMNAGDFDKAQNAARELKALHPKDPSIDQKLDEVAKAKTQSGTSKN